MTPLLTLDEAAEALRCSRRTIDRLLADGRLRATFVGHDRRISPRELEAYIAANTKRRVA